MILGFVKDEEAPIYRPQPADEHDRQKELAHLLTFLKQNISGCDSRTADREGEDHEIRPMIQPYALTINTSMLIIDQSTLPICQPSRCHMACAVVRRQSAEDACTPGVYAPPIWNHLGWAPKLAVTRNTDDGKGRYALGQARDATYPYQDCR